MIRILALNLVFGLYISYRIHRTFFSKFKFYITVPIIFLFAQSFFVLKVIGAISGVYIPDWLMSISYVLLGVAVYLLLYFLFFDILWLLRIRFKFFSNTKLAVGIIVIFLTAVTFIYGYSHQLDTKIKHYNISINKQLEKPLHIAVISDIHIGSGMTVKRLEKYVTEINQLKPDIILIAGDIIDSDLRAFTTDFRSVLQKLDAPMGVYAILGNHEYYSGDINDVIAAIEDADIKLLKDETVFFEDKGIYLVGRDSLRHSVSKGSERMSVTELTKQFDNAKPIIVMDHIPSNTKDGQIINADLQISGHTHGGQFFPVTEIVKRIYPIGSGHLKENNFNLIVTSGLGLWGPPLRVGSDSEILYITVSGK